MLPSDRPFTLFAPNTTLVIEPQAGCVATSWLVENRERLVLPQPREQFLQTMRTGGIPLLYPYANRLRWDHFTVAGREVNLSRDSNLKRDNNQLPMHGLLLRWNAWRVERLSESCATATLVWNQHPALMQVWPFAHILRLQWQLSSEGNDTMLVITTTIEADGGMDVPAAWGWHPYFLVQPDTPIHLPPRARINLDARGLPVLPIDHGATLPACEIQACRNADDLFVLENPAKAHAMVQASGQAMRIECDQSYSHMQVYSPLPEAMTKSFACIEPMMAATSAICDDTAKIVLAGQTLQSHFTLHLTL